MASPEIPENPEGLFGTEDSSYLIDSKLAAAVTDLTKMISKHRGVENLYAKYFTLGVPSSVASALNEVMKVAKNNDDSYEHPKPSSKALRHGLVGGFILGRRMVKRWSYPSMTAFQTDALNGLAKAAGDRGGDIQDCLYATDSATLDVRNRLDQVRIADLAFGEEATPFTKELFLRSVSYLGGSALCYMGIRVQLESQAIA